MNQESDSPGIYIPPPVFFAVTFLLGIFLQRKFPISTTFFDLEISTVFGDFFIIISLIIGFSALLQFYKTRNTFKTHRPATSLQTSGVYSISRNPMYTGSYMFYIGLAFMIGNWWNFIFLPLLFFVFKGYVIRKEERYLERKFGQEYLDYKSRVRRWL